MKKGLYFLSTLLIGGLLFTGCKNDDNDQPDPKLEPLNSQVRVQVAYDNSDVAFKFTWKSQKKLYPAGFANTGKNYPGQFHDMLKHNGTKFDRLPSGQRMEEDRVTFMIDKYDGSPQGFATASCAITCHTGMESHNLLSAGTIDHWHWRGGRSGPMGYAEDAAVNETERIRDAAGTAPTKFIRSGGDRLREVQAAMTGSAHAVLTDGFPRFVFNKGKTMPGNYTIPSYFITNDANAAITDPYTGIPAVKDVSKNRSLLVIYQDMTFDNVVKVNALDLAYLVWVATDEVAHLPAHLQDITSSDFNSWKTYWATETGITAAAAALAKLDAVHAEWVSLGQNAMVTRSVGFIYPSDQHDISSQMAYDASRNEWTVVLRRKLSTGSVNDADLAGLATGTKYSFSFAMHDAGAAAISHDISLPLVIANNADFDIHAISVSSLNSVDWNVVPAHDTYWVKQEFMPHYYLDWLKSSSHPGAGTLETMKCVDCHKDNKSLLTSGIVN